MSLLDNYQCKIVSKVQITIKWYQIRMTSLQEGTQVSVPHIRQSHPPITFHPLNIFTEQLTSPSQHAIFREYSLSVPSVLRCLGHPGHIKGTF